MHQNTSRMVIQSTAKVFALAVLVVGVVYAQEIWGRVSSNVELGLEIDSVRSSLLVCGDSTESTTPGSCYELEAVVTELASGGSTGGKKICHSANANDQTRNAGIELAVLLQRIIGDSFEVVECSVPEGITIGTIANWGTWVPGSGLPAATMLDDESHLIHSDGSIVWLIGETSAGVEQSVWSFLHHIGYRQYFPHPAWEILPNLPNLQVELSRVHRPRFESRTFYYGYGAWRAPDGVDANRPVDVSCGTMSTHACDLQRWRRQNQVLAPRSLLQPHIYPNIKEWWETHFRYRETPGGTWKPLAFPEELLTQRPAPDGSLQPSRQFCLTSTVVVEVRDWSGPEHATESISFDAAEIAKNYWFAKIEADPNLDVLSMEPADGYGAAGWLGCTSDAAAFPTISDRVVWLANEVAFAFPDRTVAINAYSAHSLPPEVQVPASNVAVSVTTSWSAPGISSEQLFDMWKLAGARKVGFLAYFDGIATRRDIPAGFGEGGYYARLDQLRFFLDSGADFVSIESGGGWALLGPMNLSFARAGWTEESDSLGAFGFDVVSDMLGRAFPNTGGHIGGFYDALYEYPLFSRDLIGSLYLSLTMAWPNASADERSRISQLALYVRYLEYLKVYEEQCLGSSERQSRFEEWLRYTYSIRHEQIVHSHGLWQAFAPAGTGVGRDSTVRVPANARHNCPGADCQEPNPWKSDVKPTVDLAFLQAGRFRNPFVPYEYDYGSSGIGLKPASVPYPAESTSLKRRNPAPMRGDPVLLTWTEAGAANFQITTGAVPAVCRANAVADVSFNRLLPSSNFGTANINGCDTAHNVLFEPLQIGLHSLSIEDYGQAVELEWEPGTPTVAFLNRASDNVRFHHNWTGFFYVPSETTVVGGWAERNLQLFSIYQNSSGQWRRTNLNTADHRQGEGCDLPNDAYVKEHFAVPVPAAAAGTGQIWGFAAPANGRLVLETVPPFLVRDVDEFLLPQYVIDKDNL